MSKEDALNALTGKISKADVEAYTDIVYVDVADPLINGLDAHSQSQSAHGIPDLINLVNSKFTEVGEAIKSKMGVDYEELALKADVAGDTFSGTVKSDMTGDAVLVDGPTGSSREMVGKTGESKRWQVALGDDAPETGGNEGAEFSVSRYDDTGKFLGTPFGIDRKTGKTYVNRINVGGTLMAAAGLDIRYQETRPTEDLELGTVWIIKEPVAACGEPTIATLEANLLRPWWGSTGNLSERISGGAGDNTLVDDLDSTYVTAFMDTAKEAFGTYAVLPPLDVPYGVTDFNMKVTVRARKMQSIPTITGYTPSTNVIDPQSMLELDLYSIIRNNGYALPETRANIENPAYSVNNEYWFSYGAPTEIIADTWTDYVLEFSNNNMLDMYEVFLDGLRSGAASLQVHGNHFNSAARLSNICGVDVSKVSVEVTYIETLCAPQVPYMQIPDRSFVAAWASRATPLNATQFIGLDEFGTKIRVKVQSFDTHEIMAAGIFTASGGVDLFVPARVSDTSFVMFGTVGGNGGNLVAAAGKVNPNGTITFGTQTLIRDIPLHTWTNGEPTAVGLSNNRVGVIYPLINDYQHADPYTSRIYYDEFTVDPTTLVISGIQNITVEPDVDIDFGGWMVTDAKADTASDGICAIIGKWVQGSGYTTQFQQSRKILHIVAGTASIAPVIDASYTLPPDEIFTNTNLTTRSVKFPLYLEVGESDSVYFTCFDLIYTSPPEGSLAEIPYVRKFARSGNTYQYEREFQISVPGSTEVSSSEYWEFIYDGISKAGTNIYLGSNATGNVNQNQKQHGAFLVTINTLTDVMNIDEIDVQPFEVTSQFYDWVLNPWSPGSGVVYASMGLQDYEESYDGPLILKNTPPAPISEYGFTGDIINMTNVANMTPAYGEEYYNVVWTNAVKVSPNRAIVAWGQLATEFGTLYPSVPSTIEFALVGSVNGEIVVLDTYTHNLPQHLLEYNYSHSQGFSMELGGETRAIFMMPGHVWHGYNNPEKDAWWLADTHAADYGYPSSNVGILANVGVVGDQLDIGYVSTYGGVRDLGPDPIPQISGDDWFSAMPLPTGHVLVMANSGINDQQSLMIRINASTGIVAEHLFTTPQSYGHILANDTHYVIYQYDKSYRGTHTPLSEPTAYLNDDFSTAIGLAKSSVDFNTYVAHHESTGLAIIGYYGSGGTSQVIDPDDFVHYKKCVLNNDFTISGTEYTSVFGVFGTTPEWSPGIPRNVLNPLQSWANDAVAILPNGHLGAFGWVETFGASDPVLMFEHGLGVNGIGDTSPFSTGVLPVGSDVYFAPLKFEGEFPLDGYGNFHDELDEMLEVIVFDDGTGFGFVNVVDNWYGMYYRGWILPFKVPTLPA